MMLEIAEWIFLIDWITAEMMYPCNFVEKDMVLLIHVKYTTLKCWSDDTVIQIHRYKTQRCVQLSKNSVQNRWTQESDIKELIISYDIPRCPPCSALRHGKNWNLQLQLDGVIWNVKYICLSYPSHASNI